jgi:hypothetical protein
LISCGKDRPVIGLTSHKNLWMIYSITVKEVFEEETEIRKVLLGGESGG